MDRITLAGHSAPAVVQNSGAAAVASKFSPVSPVETVSNASSNRHGSSNIWHSDELSAEDVQRKAVEAVRTAVNEAGAAIDEGSRLVIRKDDDTGRFVYEFRHSQTGELVRQFPAEQVLQALASFRQAMTGKVVDRQA